MSGDCKSPAYGFAGSSPALPIKYLIDYCKAHLGAKEYLLHTVKGNTAAESVYRSVGFTEDVNGFYLKI